MEKQIYKENKRLEFIKDLILEASYKQNNTELLKVSLKKIVGILGIDYGYILSYPEKGNSNGYVEAHHNLPECFLEDIISCQIKNKMINDSIRKNVVVFSDEDLDTLQQRVISKKYNLKTLITVPIGYTETFTAKLLLLFSCKEREHFLQYVPLLETVGNTLWMLLQKQRIYEDYNNRILSTEKLRALGELAGGVAHDFNNLLTTILGFSQIALTQELEDDIEEYFSIIYKSAIDGKRIVDRIQSYNRKYFDQNKEDCLINSIVESAIDMVKPRWKNYYETNGTSLVIIKDIKSRGKINCVEHEIREVIINLLSNAMDSMEDGGTLTIKTYDQDDKVVVEIGDTGSGIPEEIQKEVFEPFYSTKGEKGTGLGLSIAKDIMSSHNGSIQLESILGKGTTIKLFFTRTTIEKKSDISCDSDTYTNKDMNRDLNILVIDDIGQVGHTIVQMLKAIGINGDIEIESVKAIHRLEEKDYDVIICDLAMPEINGIDLSVIIKEHYPNIKFILLTGWPGNLKEEDYENIDFILRKPITIEELTQAIKEVL
ncbi:MAG: ATP-binding protein [Tissierellales bacterium]